MLRLRGIRVVAVTATTAAAATGFASTGLPRCVSSLPSIPRPTVELTPTSTRAPVLRCTQRFFGFPAGNLQLRSRVLTIAPPARAAASVFAASAFLRGARVPALPCWAPPASYAQYRWIRVRGREKEGGGGSGGTTEEAEAEGKGEENARNTEQESKEGARDTKAKGEKKGDKGQSERPRGFGDHIRGLRQDYAMFPDIYNSVNALNFIIFTVFCLCSTGSNTEERWWMEQWGLDNSLRPWTWLLHSFLTNNFLSMTYAMMLLHSLCHQLMPAFGSRGLILYCGGTAVISGGIMWLGNRLYYGSSGAAVEKQFGPWDVVSALFVATYLQYGITPFSVLNSFSGWVKYACWVGQICICYFDWQPTVVGTVVGLALCKGKLVPGLKMAK